MKKLLILMLVLGLTSLANATMIDVDGNVELSVGGVTNGVLNTAEVTINTCETLLIDVMGPYDGDYMAFVGIMGSFPNVTGGEWGDEFGPPYLAMCNSYYYEASGYPITYAAAGDVGLAGMARLEYADWGYGYLVSAGALGHVPGGKQFDLLYHCCSVGDVTIEIYDFATWNLADTVIVHQVPEPMTITLLSLGGLLLRRRK